MKRALIGSAGLLSAAVGVAWGLGAAATSLAHTMSGPVPPAPGEALTLLVACLALLLVLWLGVTVLASVVAQLPGRPGRLGRRCAERVSPALSRRVAAVIVGAGLTGVLAPGTASAEPRDGLGASAGVVTTAPSPAFSPTDPAAGVPPPGVGSAAESFAAEPGAGPAPSPGWTPGRPRLRPDVSTRLVATTPPQEDSAGVVVRRGDTLWDLARRHLGPDATDAEVALAWPRWHAENRDVIGPDPHQILPGQVLRPPTAAGAHW